MSPLAQHRSATNPGLVMVVPMPLDGVDEAAEMVVAHPLDAARAHAVAAWPCQRRLVRVEDRHEHDDDDEQRPPAPASGTLDA
jgi:hypothetical protein